MIPLSDAATIDHLYRAGMKPTTIDAIATAIRNRRVDGTCLVSGRVDTGPRGAPAGSGVPVEPAVGRHGARSARSVTRFTSAHAPSTSASTWRPSCRARHRDGGQRGGHRDMAGGVITAAPLDGAAWDGGPRPRRPSTPLGRGSVRLSSDPRPPASRRSRGPRFRVVDTAVQRRSDRPNDLPDAVPAGRSDDAVSVGNCQ